MKTVPVDALVVAKVANHDEEAFEDSVITVKESAVPTAVTVSKTGTNGEPKKGGTPKGGTCTGGNGNADPPKKPSAGCSETFYFADKIDVMMIVFGSLCAMVQGASFPLMVRD
jgi:hypothetical protein